MQRCDPLSVTGGVELTPSTYGLFESGIFNLVLENPLSYWAECRLEINGKPAGDFNLDPIDRLTVANDLSGARFCLTPDYFSGGQRALLNDPERMRVVAHFRSPLGEDLDVVVSLVSLGPLPVEPSPEQTARLLALAEYRVWKDYSDAFHFEHDEVMVATVPFVWKALPDEDAISRLASYNPEEVKDALRSHREARKRYLDQMVERAKDRIRAYLEDQTHYIQS